MAGFAFLWIFVALSVVFKDHDLSQNFAPPPILMVFFIPKQHNGNAPLFGLRSGTAEVIRLQQSELVSKQKIDEFQQMKEEVRKVPPFPGFWSVGGEVGVGLRSEGVYVYSFFLVFEYQRTQRK